MKNMIRAALAAVFVLLGTGCSNDSIPPGTTGKEAAGREPPRHVTTVEQTDVQRVYEAVGTIRPVTESVIESQIRAQILSVSVTAGQQVTKGQVLVTLDARQLTSRVQQAEEQLQVARKQLAQTRKSINEARAGLDQAEAAYERSQKLFDAGVIPSQKLEIDKSAFLQAKARLERAKEAELSARSSIRQAQEVVKEAQIAHGYAQITAPDDGIVTERSVDPGDLAVPGKPLMVIQTSGALRLEAHVREGLIGTVKVGQTFDVEIQTVDRTVSSTIQEIVPYADPATRTFLVKASLPAIPGIYPGMFGRLRIPVKQEKTLLIPQKAVRHVGQLEMVSVKQDGGWRSVYIKTGKRFDAKIEVLAGLTGSETIGYND